MRCECDGQNCKCGNLRHEDFELALIQFTDKMRSKLQEKDQSGWASWQDDDFVDKMRRGLVAHVASGDPIDVANYCMFLWNLHLRTMP